MTEHWFKAKREDGRSLWQVAFDFLVDEMEKGNLAPGGVISHEDLAGAMDAKFPSGAYYQAAVRAGKELQEQYGRSLRAVKGEGYRLIAGRAMVDKGLDHQVKSRTQMAMAVKTVSAVKAADLSGDDEKTLVRKIRDGLMLTAQVLDMQAEKVAEHEREIEMLKSARIEDRARVRATEDELTEMRDRLQRLEEQSKAEAEKPPKPST